MSGPVLIFDKSALEALDHDEAVWLDNFFTCNITPLFFIETLADLEKEVRAGRTPEQVVGNIARKTPDMQSIPNIHHWQLLALELSGAAKVAMDGRVIIFGGKRVQLGGSKGLVVRRNLAEEAFCRWQQGQFLDLERQIAKVWRKNVSNVNYDQPYSFFRNWYPNGVKPRDLADCKRLADDNIDYTDQESRLEFGLSLLRVPDCSQQDVVKYWRRLGKPPIRDFAPYFRYVFGVELFFYLAIAADLISRVRPANKADNKVDIAYLYYLPFCHIFTSNDSLHERVVPLFLRHNQTFVKGQELKADLAKLDTHYSSLSEDVKAAGIRHFAALPPSDDSFLVARLWDKHLPKYRRSQAKQEKLTPELQQALLQLVRRVKEESRPLDPAERLSFSETNFLQMERRITPKKGKWLRVPPNVA